MRAYHYCSLIKACISNLMLPVQSIGGVVRLLYYIITQCNDSLAVALSSLLIWNDLKLTLQVRYDTVFSTFSGRFLPLLKCPYAYVV